MSTIGVGKAMRDQAREGRRSRARRTERVEDRRARTRDADWEGHDQELATCAGCGCEDAVCDMYTGALGLVCAPCFSEGEGEIAAPEVPSLTASALRPLGWAPLIFLPHILSLFIDPGVLLGASLPWPITLVLLCWMVGVGGGLLGSPLLVLFAVERLREGWRRPGLEPEERAVLVGGQLWQSLSVPVMLAVALWTASGLVF